MKFASLRPYLVKATNTFILKYLDRKTYDLIVANTNLKGDQTEVRELLKQAVAEYSIYLALAKNITVISDMGAVESTNENTQPISKWKLQLTRWSCICDGDTALDQALAIIENNSVDFRDFHESKQFKDFTTIFFRHTLQFEQMANISGRRAFLSLVPHIRKAERDLKKVLCGEFENVVSFITAQDNNEVKTEKVELCRSYIATLAMIKGIVKTSKVFIGHKYQLASNTESYDTRAKMQVTWLGGMDQLVFSLQSDLSQVTDDIYNLLEDNKNEFPKFAKENSEENTDGSIYLGDDCVGGIGIF